MKKIISILTVIVMFAISCMSTTMASFSVPDMEMNIDMQHEKMNSSSECCDTMKSNCDDNIHECCFSPFKDSNITSNISFNNENKKIKIKTFTIDFFAILQESFEYNYIQKLTSPPDWNWWKQEEKWYISLTWIIKSNC